MSLLNNFKLGADPEFVLLDEAGQLINFRDSVPPYSPWGTDHSNWVIEPHPKPELSVKQLVKNIHVSLDDFAVFSPASKWRAGAYYHSGQRNVTLGGHVHIDLPTYSSEQVNALDRFEDHMEALDLLPSSECATRKTTSLYGKASDIRAEHGHFEYRTYPSWLFSQRITKICLVGSKLGIVDPKGMYNALGTRTTASLLKVKNFFERFKGKDDDVDWILAGGILNKSLKVRPDRDLRDVWKVQPKRETPHWKQLDQTQRRNIGVAAGVPTRVFLTPGRRIVTLTGSAVVEVTESMLSEIDSNMPRHFSTVFVGGWVFRYVGIEGNVWPGPQFETVAPDLVRHEVARMRYSWWVLRAQHTSETLPILREIVISGRIPPDPGMRVIEGLLLSYRGSTEVPPRGLF